MSRLSLLALQLLVAMVVLALWQLLATVPVFGKIWLPPFSSRTLSTCSRRLRNGSRVA